MNGEEKKNLLLFSYFVQYCSFKVAKHKHEYVYVCVIKCRIQIGIIHQTSDRFP